MPTVSADKSGFLNKDIYPFILGISGAGTSENGNNIVKITCKSNARICFLTVIVGNNYNNSLKYIYRNGDTIQYKNLVGYEGYSIKYKFINDGSYFTIYIGTVYNWGKVAIIPFTLDINSIETISEYDSDLIDAVKNS